MPDPRTFEQGLAFIATFMERFHHPKEDEYLFKADWLRPALAGVVFLSAAMAAAAPPTSREMTEFSLEQLANLEITSVSKRPERLADAPASVFVITAEEIRRSGATSLPEALRLAPNLQVAQASANAYNIRARGMTNNSANKLLVLIDGRSVYTPLFAGVFWDVQEVMLEDVERIEVISGPGGTLWGVNAVNGVINLISRTAQATQGGLLAAAGGNALSSGAIRIGGELGQNGHYRIHGRYLDRTNTETAAGTLVDDAAHLAQTGFRADWASKRGSFTVQGNAYRGTIGQPVPGSISISGVNLALAALDVSGANLSARWTHRFGGGSEALLQAYIDRTERTVPPTFAEKLDIVDLQFQHSTRWAAYALVWGAQQRYSRDRLVNSEIFAFLPANVDQKWGSLFAQAEATPAANLRLTAGARLERNDYTGTEILPNVRLAWTPSAGGLLWTAASRTVRAPSRLDRDPFIPGAPPFLLAGGPDVRSEVAEVHEIGYRAQTKSRMSYSVTLFRASYDHLHTQEVAPSGTFIVFASQLEATTHGVELWAALQASEHWRVSAGYTAQRQFFRLKPGSNDRGAVGRAASDPAHTWLLRSSWNLARRWELDLTVRGVAALSSPNVPRYATADLRLGWMVRPGLEIALAARNLGDGGHGEFTPVQTRTEVERSIYAGVSWHFDAR